MAIHARKHGEGGSQGNCPRWTMGAGVIKMSYEEVGEHFDRAMDEVDVYRTSFRGSREEYALERSAIIARHFEGTGWTEDEFDIELNERLDRKDYRNTMTQTPSGFSEEQARSAAAEYGLHFTSYFLSLLKLFGDQSPLWLKAWNEERTTRRARGGFSSEE